MVRAFIGIFFPEDVKEYLVSLQRQLEALQLKAKFVEPENLHISLSFLNNVERDELEAIKSVLDKISERYTKFELILGNIILIPNEKFTRVIALEVKSDILESIRKEIVKTVDGESNPTHVTLARVKTIENKPLFIKGISKMVCKETSVKVDSICLIESVLTRTGPIYTILHKSYLK
ncbi:MAG: RNA 2',3'-cyclic phosphodiesterase [Candidatus Aenigmatarchaeota archaeon]|nr:RNA 2',3'-cyclic phosphodiesterase [Candidatus Aenigmarchaeota archaeon]